MKESKLVIITGASSGIGEAFAKKLSSEHYDTVLVSRNRDKLDGLAENLKNTYGTSPIVLARDLSNPQGLAEISEFISRRDDVAGLVNSAGFGTYGHFSSVDIEKSLNMINLHVVAPTCLSKVVLPKMSEGGFIINVSSLASLILTPGRVVYGGTKSYLNEFSRSLQEEVRDKGIVVQALCPGFTHTNFHNTEEYDFQKPKIPSWLWMSADQVVERSLKALGKKVVYVPGLKNRILCRLMNSPLTGLIKLLKKK